MCGLRGKRRSNPSTSSPAQLDLVVGDALGATSELRSPEHRDDMVEPIGTLGQTVDIGALNHGGSGLLQKMTTCCLPAEI